MFSKRVETLTEACSQLLPPAHEAGASLQLMCDLLRAEVSHYDWVGFYFALPSERLLVLGPFSGTPTEHTQIPYGRGICGQSAETESTFVVQDVSSQSNYLSCSLATKAEIVEPIVYDGRYIGQIDIDSHTRRPFSENDKRLLSRVAKMAAPLIPTVFAPDPS